MKLLPRAFLMALTLGLAMTGLPSAGGGPAATTIRLDPTSGPPTTTIAVTGEGFGPSEVVELRIGTKTVGSAATDALGSFMSALDVPASAPPGRRTIRARGTDSGLTASHLYAFDANGCGEAICRPLWRAFLGGPSGSSPLVHDGVVFIGSTDGNLYAFDAGGCGQVDCPPLWTGSVGPYPIFQGSPAIANGLVYPFSISGRLYVFDVPGASFAGERRIPVNVMSSGREFSSS